MLSREGKLLAAGLVAAGLALSGFLIVEFAACVETPSLIPRFCGYLLGLGILVLVPTAMGGLYVLFRVRRVA
jgi:hypothetical protein